MTDVCVLAHKYTYIPSILYLTRSVVRRRLRSKLIPQTVMFVSATAKIGNKNRFCLRGNGKTLSSFRDFFGRRTARIYLKRNNRHRGAIEYLSARSVQPRYENMTYIIMHTL